MTQETAVAGGVLEELVRRIVDSVAPEQVLLFGSQARGETHADSDYDFLVVTDSSAGERDLRCEAYDAVRGIGVEVDIIVDTPAEFAHRRTDIGTVEYAADREGRVLYERSPLPPARQVREDEGEPESVGEWLSRGDDDLHIMELLVSSAGPLHNGICLHANQSAERCLKALLVFRHIQPLHTHDVSDLIARCRPFIGAAADLTDAGKILTKLWEPSRSGKKRPSGDDARAAADAARMIREAVRRALGR